MQQKRNRIVTFEEMKDKYLGKKVHKIETNMNMNFAWIC